ncbi:protein-(glutamine-N5) methyltransferase, release factor-specific [Candidatus Peribacteria bacterium RIFCSPHIGHO2_01_FULL_51_9]|nr:MAG: protein-(glutamine-N5) methyltransferase, release factor-specific [Candidatus Peribacteria bacterium RIFCSPHIGHO2_01_FULL_51_9]
MNIGDALQQSGIHNSEKEILLSRILQRDRSWIVAHPEYILKQREHDILQEWMYRRQEGEPLAYITGTKEFYGRDFFVDRRVLIPRPSTEGLIDLTLDFLKSGQEESRTIDTGIVAQSFVYGDTSGVHTIVDIGTGSGCIGVTLALARPDLRIIALDISEDALDVARINAEKHGVSSSIEFREGDLLSPIQNLKDPFVIVSNPPYVKNDALLDREVLFEPSAALFAGPTGQELVEQLMEQAQKHHECRGLVIEYAS